MINLPLKMKSSQLIDLKNSDFIDRRSNDHVRLDNFTPNFLKE